MGTTTLKLFVGVHGGSLSVTSCLQDGTEFLVRLPHTTESKSYKPKTALPVKFFKIIGKLWMFNFKNGVVD